MNPRRSSVGRVPPHGGSPSQSNSEPDDSPPRRLRRLHRVWPARDGNISYLLTLCVDGRCPVLNNEPVFERFVVFLLDSPSRYHWFGCRFVIMPDHIHLIARMGNDAVRLGQWVKALKAVVGGLERRVGCVAFRAEGDNSASTDVGRLPSAGCEEHKFTRIQRAWKWQDGFHDHKFRNAESEARKWEYVCLNPVRAGLVTCPEQWPFGGEIFYEASGLRLVRGTPPLLRAGMLIEEPLVEGNRPTT
jgi:REP element-mobilizing transposase RayT